MTRSQQPGVSLSCGALKSGQQKPRFLHSRQSSNTPAAAASSGLKVRGAALGEFPSKRSEVRDPVRAPASPYPKLAPAPLVPTGGSPVRGGGDRRLGWNTGVKERLTLGQ